MTGRRAAAIRRDGLGHRLGQGVRVAGRRRWTVGVCGPSGTTSTMSRGSSM